MTGPVIPEHYARDIAAEAERYGRAMTRVFKGLVDRRSRTTLVKSELYRKDRPDA